MILRHLRDGRVVALLLVVALAVVVLLNQFAPTRSAYSATVRERQNEHGRDRPVLHLHGSRRSGHRERPVRVPAHRVVERQDRHGLVRPRV